jgi:hypothetical protein
MEMGEIGNGDAAGLCVCVWGGVGCLFISSVVLSDPKDNWAWAVSLSSEDISVGPVRAGPQ